MKGIEQMLAKSKLEYKISDIKNLGSISMYTAPMRIYDIGGAQMHIHGHGDCLYGGSLIEKGTNIKLKTFDGYEACMNDFYASNLGLKRIK